MSFKSALSTVQTICVNSSERVALNFGQYCGIIRLRFKRARLIHTALGNAKCRNNFVWRWI